MKDQLKVDWGNVFGTIIAVIIYGGVSLSLLYPIGESIYNSTGNICTTQTISHTSETINDSGLNVGQFTTTTGRDGEKIVCKNRGGDTKSETVTLEPVNQIVRKGTKVQYEEAYTPTFRSSYSTRLSQESCEGYPTVCNDGSCSNSTGRGTCSWHGGVSYYRY